MPIEILMPALSPTMEEGTLAKWHVKEGDTIASGDIIAEIETDKATMEVEAVDEGVIGKILVAAGTEGVKVNATIALLLAEGEAAGDGIVSAKAAPAAPAPMAAAMAAPTPTPPAAPSASAASMVAHGAVGEDGRNRASPLARRMAATAGIDLGAIPGSGPGGRVVKRDIEAAANRPATASAMAPAATAAPGMVPAAPAQALVPSTAPATQVAVRDPRALGIAEGSYDLVPLDGMRKTIARRMTDSFRDVPHFPLTVDIALDSLLEQRKRLNDRVAADGVKISVNDFLIRASALALKKVPASNASYSPDGLLMHRHADIAVAVAIDGGLITPIIRAAETKGMAQISHEMKDLAERARARKLMPEEYSGGSFSISNLGMFGIKQFASILNEPHGMILSVGAGEPRPVVKDGALQVATVMTVTLTCDHRVVDGSIGAEFLKAFKTFCEAPETMLL